MAVLFYNNHFTVKPRPVSTGQELEDFVAQQSFTAGLPLLMATNYYLHGTMTKIKQPYWQLSHRVIQTSKIADTV